MMTPQVSELATQLVNTGYEQYFLVYGDDAINAVWNQPGAPAALAALVLDNSAGFEARFLAAEILFYKDKSYPPDSAKSALALVYAATLANDYMHIGNPWGLPGHLDSVGQHVVNLGEVAVPQLVLLLDDDAEILYDGSEEATIGNAYEYRVKDFAAFFISKIKGIPYTVEQTPAERDEEIEKLKTKLS